VNRGRSTRVLEEPPGRFLVRLTGGDEAVEEYPVRIVRVMNRLLRIGAPGSR
jgi:hypothetical protein